MTDAPQPLSGRTIGITADRRWQEQADLFTKRGATVVHGPTMQTVDVRSDPRLRAATDALLAEPPDVTVVTTGMGMKMWLEIAEEWGVREPLLRALGASRVVTRGAKAASAVRAAGLDVAWRAPSESMAEVVDHLADARGQRIAVQLFEPEGHRSTEALRTLAGALVELPLYQWRLPDDVAPAERLVDAIAEKRVDAVTFTSQPAVHHLFRIAEGTGRADAVREALAGAVLAACIGPVCAEAAHDEGVDAVVWPEPNRLPAMVRLVTERLTG